MNDKPELLGKMIRERRKKKKMTQEGLIQNQNGLITIAETKKKEK